MAAKHSHNGDMVEEKSRGHTDAASISYDGSIAAESPGDSHGTKRGLKSRHAQLIALGGTIGTALFVGSGVTLSKGGPGFLLLTYLLMAGLVILIVSAIIQYASYL